MDPAVTVVDVEGATDLRGLMEEQTRLCQPLVIRGALAEWPAATKWDPGAGGFDRLEALAGDASVQVMVAPVGKAFYGDVRSKQLLATTFKEFLHMAKAAANAETDDVNEQLYLAQAPLLDAEQDCPQPLAPLLEDVRMPSFLDDEKVTNVNLWVSVNGSKSSTHYDPYQNLLCVVAGEKTVSLWDPRATPGLYPMALHGEAFNHSAVNFAAPDHARFPGYRAVLERRKTVTVRAGDALFIPEGWWHQVDSCGTTIAVNIWWQSRFSALLGTHMDAYYARQAIASLLFTEKKRRLDSVNTHRLGSPDTITRRPSSQIPPGSSDPGPPGHTQSEVASVAQQQSPSSTALKATKKKKSRRKKAAASPSAHRVDKGVLTEVPEEGEEQMEPSWSDPQKDRMAAVAGEAAQERAGPTDGCDTVGGIASAAAGSGSLGAEATGEGDAEQAAPSKSGRLPGPVVPALPLENGKNCSTIAEPGPQPQPNVASDGHGNGRMESTSRREMQSSADSRRRVVQCLSPKEAQLLQTLVLEAGQRHDRNGTNGMSGRMDGTECGGSEGPGRSVRQPRETAEGIVGEEERGRGDWRSGDDDVAGVFAAAETAQLRRVLLAMAVMCLTDFVIASLALETAFPRALERLVLYGLSPIAAELLTTRFDDFDKLDPSPSAEADDDPLHIDPPPAFFERFYAVFEDRNAAMAALLDGKEAFAAEALRNVLDELQGVSDVSAQSGMTKEPVR